MERLFLYQISNLVNGKRYIGWTNNPEHRWQTHRTGNGSRLVAAAIRKYGLDQFEFELISCGPEEYIKKIEALIIKAFQTRTFQWGYNIGEGGEGGNNRGMKHSDETRKKISNTHKVIQPNRHWSSSKFVMLDGHEYPSISEAAKQLNIKETTLWHRVQRQRDRGITDLLSNPPRPEFTLERKQVIRKALSKPITFDGVMYSSLTTAAIDLNIKTSTLYNRVQKQRNRGIIDLLSNPPRRKGHTNQGAREARSRPIILDNILYSSLTSAAIDLNINKQTLRSRVWRQRQLGVSEKSLKSNPNYPRTQRS